MIILLQIFLNCYYYYTFRHNISVRKIKPNPAFTLLNLYTIQFTVRSKPTQRPKPSPLTLNTVDNSRNKTRQNTLFFPPNNHHSTRQNTHLTKEYFYQGRKESHNIHVHLVEDGAQRHGKEGDESARNECTRTSRI